MTPGTQSSYWAILRKQMPFSLSISEQLPAYFLHACIRQFIFCYSVYSWSGWQMVLEPIPTVTGQEAGIPPGQATSPSEPISRRPNAHGVQEETKVENAWREQREHATSTYDGWESNPEPAWSGHSTNTTPFLLTALEKYIIFMILKIPSKEDCEVCYYSENRVLKNILWR